jgi:hypothetical protein
MRAAMLTMVLVLAGCGGMSEQQAADVTRGIMARAGHATPPPGTPQTEQERDEVAARLAAENQVRLRRALDRERLDEARAQAFGMEARMTRLAMACDDPGIRRVAYATADMQAAAFERLYRRSPRLAQISAAEETRMRNRTYGATPSPAQCRQLLTVMGQSAKAIRDGER